MNEQKHCPNCGAPITTEVCPYCKNFTGLDTKNADMEYPVMDCKEAHMNFWNTIFPLIFAVSFGFFGFIFPIITIINSEDIKTGISVLLFCSIFGIIGLAAGVITIRSVLKYTTLKRNGQEIYGTVYGYMNDNMYLNEMPAQIVKILVDTGSGPRFILYQLGDTKKPYKINSKIKLKYYKNIFMIEDNNEQYM